MADLDELKAKWDEQNRRLEKSIRLNCELFRATKLTAVESELRRTAIYAGLEAGMWLIVVIALGNFIAVHMRTRELAFSAAAADVMSIGMTIALIRRMAGALHIDYAGPIAAIQKQVETLRILRIRTIQRGVLFGSVLWVPWLAVTLYGIFGVDLYRGADPAWLTGNVLFGLALFPAARWVSKKYGVRLGHSPLIQRMAKDLAGSELNAAQTFLARLEEFERE